MQKEEGSKSVGGRRAISQKQEEWNESTWGSMEGFKVEDLQGGRELTEEKLQSCQGAPNEGGIRSVEGKERRWKKDNRRLQVPRLGRRGSGHHLLQLQRDRGRLSNFWREECRVPCRQRGTQA